MKWMKNKWWKYLTLVIMMWVCTMGFIVQVPHLDGRLQESIRNLFFHVPMWIGMMVLLTLSVIYAVKYLGSQKTMHDIISKEFAAVGLLYSFLGFFTGMIWANYQWGAPWSGDPKQIGTVIATLIYCAYFVVRGSMTDVDKSAKVSAVYNIFAYCMLFPTIWILPRFAESLHPGGQGSEGNPALNPNDSSDAMKWVMIPAFMGWTLIGIWIATLRIRLAVLFEKRFNK